MQMNFWRSLASKSSTADHIPLNLTRFFSAVPTVGISFVLAIINGFVLVALVLVAVVFRRLLVSSGFGGNSAVISGSIPLSCGSDIDEPPLGISCSKSDGTRRSGHAILSMRLPESIFLPQQIYREI